MDFVDKPICTIIAGPNGAGKTTFALKYLPEVEHCRNFVNADMIAAGLSPLAPEREWLAAGRLFLKEIKHYTEKRESFAFETTLAGKTYLRMIRNLLDEGWEVNLFYLWLPSVEHSISRVAERVRHGGHDIPEKTLRRRYPRSVKNLVEFYSQLCTFTMCSDNTENPPQQIFTQSSSGRVIITKSSFRQMELEALK